MKFHLFCTNPENFNPGGRPKLPTEIREMYQARSQVEVLTRCLQSDDDNIAMMAAQAILDRGYGKPTQSIDANVTEDGGLVCYYGEVPKKANARRLGWSRLGRGQVFPNWTRPTDDLEGAADDEQRH